MFPTFMSERKDGDLCRIFLSELSLAQSKCRTRFPDTVARNRKKPRKKRKNRKGSRM